LVKLHNLLLNEGVVGYKTYNVSTAKGTSIKDLADLVVKASGQKVKPLFEEVPEGEYSKFMPERKRIPAELIKMVLSYKQAKKDLGWRPEMGLEEGIKREYEWIKNNPGFWQEDKEIKV